MTIVWKKPKYLVPLMCFQFLLIIYLEGHPLTKPKKGAVPNNDAAIMDSLLKTWKY